MQIRDEMACQELVELVTEYFEGTLSLLDRARFEAHLAECPYCRIYLEQMRQTIRLLGKLDVASLPAAREQELLRLFRDWHRAGN